MFMCYAAAEGIILNIKHFKLSKGSVIQVFLAEKPNLDPEGCSLIWPVGEFGWEFAAGPQGMVFYLFVL